MNTSGAANRQDASRAAEIFVFFTALWLVLSPFIFRFASVPAALWNSVCVGLFLIVLSFVRLRNLRSTWPNYIDAALAAWLVLAPFALGYAGLAVPLLNHLIAASLLCLLATGSIMASPRKPFPNTRQKSAA